MVNKQPKLTARATRNRRSKTKTKHPRDSRRKEMIKTRAEINEKRNEGSNSKGQ